MAPMNLFINDTPFFLLRSLAETDHLANRNIVQAGQVGSLGSLQGTVVMLEVPTDKVLGFLQDLMSHHYEDVSFRIIPEDYNEAKAQVRAQFKVIDAAGGVVINKSGRILMIYRLKKWDLPKGKVDKGETFKMTAVREVEEETGVRVRLRHRITTTWHTYTIKDNPILKRTKWYLMDCLDDSAMKPQKVENIEKVAWLDEAGIAAALSKSYRSIRHVIDCYQRQVVP